MKLLSTIVALGTGLTLSSAATLQQITTDFGANPTNASFYIYVPDVLAKSPPILVNPHWCHGSAQDAYAGRGFADLADKYGFIVIYPGSPNSADSCWDVSSLQTLTHRGGGDSLGIVSMVKWALLKYRADASRVFVSGVSSGGMMTNVLIGAYPDVFAAGSAWADVPFGCFAAPGNNSGQYDYWNSDCATGLVTHTPAQWKAIVQAAYPGYDGWRPKFQIFHGTVDEIVSYNNFLEGIKEWTAVLCLDEKPVRTIANTPLANWTKSVYGSDGWFEAVSAAGVPHNIPVQFDAIVEYFDLACTKNCFKWGHKHGKRDESSEIVAKLEERSPEEESSSSSDAGTTTDIVNHWPSETSSSTTSDAGTTTDIVNHWPSESSSSTTSDAGTTTDIVNHWPSESSSSTTSDAGTTTDIVDTPGPSRTPTITYITTITITPTSDAGSSSVIVSSTPVTTPITTGQTLGGQW
jgi:acetylxylan esterase